MDKSNARPTVRDLAKAANVSLATIDRVLNERAGVREKTILRVHEAIEKIGFVRDMSAANLARQRHYRLVFVLPDGPSAILGKLQSALTHARQRAIVERTHIETMIVPANDPFKLAAELRQFEDTEVDGIAIMAPETPNVRDAIRHLKDSGKSVVAMITDLPNSDRDHFVGINNVAAGRTAAQLLGRFMCRPQTGERADILVLASSISSRDQIERRLGFDQVINASFPHTRVLPSIVGWDDPEIIVEILDRTLGANPAIHGIYSMGAGNHGVIRALESLKHKREIKVVAHEITPATRHGLNHGLFDAVVAQDFGHVVRSAIRVLRAQSDRLDVVAAQERIRIEIILRDNMPEAEA